MLRAFSYSDRIRYYWNVPEVQRAAEKLIANLFERVILETLLSAYLPAQYGAVREGKPGCEAAGADIACKQGFAEETSFGCCEWVLAGR